MSTNTSANRRWLLSFFIILAVITVGWFTVLSPPAQTRAATDPPAAAKPMTLAEAEKAYQDASAVLADLLWMRAEDHWHTGAHDRVIELCHHIVDLDPAFVEAYNTGAWLAWSQLTPKGDKAALEFYNRGMKANPQDWEIAFECGNFFYQIHKEDPRSAIPYLRRAVAVAERHAREPKEIERKIIILRSLGHALRKDGRAQEALKVFKRVLQIDPTDAVAQKEVNRLEEGGSAQ